MSDVESKNQSGGITSYKVNIKNQYNVKNTKHPKKWLNILKIGVPIAMLLLAILSYLNIRPKELKMDKNENNEKGINVTSHNQSGGITAYKVNFNIGNQPRVFNQEMAKTLKKYLPMDKSKVINMEAVAMDQEALRFAIEIRSYLIKEGYAVDKIMLVMKPVPVFGQIINKRADGGVDIIIGSNDGS